MRSVAFQLLCAMLAALVAGCDERPTASAQPAQPAAAVLGSSTISGRVLLRGTAPVLPPIDVSGVADCARLHPDGIPDEAIVAAPGGALQNAIVYLKGAAPDSLGPSRPPAVLDQVGCRYRPHVLAVETGQTLRVESHDPFLHNVHMECATDSPSNFSQIAQVGQPAVSETRFSSPQIFPVRCDIHPWMRAWVGVFDNSFFAVTDATGAFRIDHVPPGNFTLCAWHERFGEVAAPVGVTQGKDVAMDLAYSR